MNKRHNLPKVDLGFTNSVVEKEKVSVTQKEETVRYVG